MVNIVGVRFKKAGKIYYFDPLDLELIEGDAVIVETARGVELGVVAIGEKPISDEEVVAPLKPVLRKATDEDIERHRKNIAREKEAMVICKEKIADHGLEMKLVDVEFTFDMNKVIFYFTADGRVDFRNLVKDLASVFRTRIELRQIGVRDEAKMKSGIGPCGRTLCCSSFLSDFTSVSIKMAKEQSLSLNPSKISGICGRLMCCLKYEQETYEEIRKRLPRYGSIVNTPLGRGEVINNNTIKEEIKVKIFGDGDDVIEYFPISECEMIKGSYEASSGKSNRKKDIEGDEQKNSNPKKEQLKNQDQEETGSDEQASQPGNLD
ncbi:MAG: stage 0 sporulation family protein [Clostridium sp.]|nr:stage 0 sporulation family protein [Clostridium sp.]